MKLRIYHFGIFINSVGHVSAACFGRPKKINLRSALWTTRSDSVTCKKCIKAMSIGGRR